MIWLGFLMLFLAALYISIERGHSPRERTLRWMVLLGALILSVLIGSGSIG